MARTFTARQRGVHGRLRGGLFWIRRGGARRRRRKTRLLRKLGRYFVLHRRLYGHMELRFKTGKGAKNHVSQGHEHPLHLAHELPPHWRDVALEVFSVVNDEETNVKFTDDDGPARKRHRKERYYGERA